MAKKELPFAPPDWPALNAKPWPLGKIKPYPNNPRSHPESQVMTLANLMKRWGVDQPIVVDEHGVILKGHGRLAAAHLAGFAEFPVVQHLGLEEDEKRAIRIADNQVSLLSSWDDALLQSEIVQLNSADFDLPLLGFERSDIRRLLDSNPGQSDPDEVLEPPKDPVVRAGDLWALGRHQILCGDATKAADVERLLVGRPPNLMVTDPPYGVNYNPEWRFHAKGPDGRRLSKGKVSMGEVINDDRADWREAWELFPGNVAYVWHSALWASVVQNSLALAGFVVRSQIIWAKQQLVIGRGDYHWRHEPCWYVVRKGKPGGWTGDRKQSTVWEIQNHAGATKKDDGATDHGTQKPVDCMLRPMLNNSKPGDYIYDPFVGSGSTIIAAESSGRACLAVDIDPSYVQVAIERWQNFTGLEATCGGKTLAQRKRSKKR